MPFLLRRCEDFPKSSCRNGCMEGMITLPSPGLKAARITYGLHPSELGVQDHTCTIGFPKGLETHTSAQPSSQILMTIANCDLRVSLVSSRTFPGAFCRGTCYHHGHLIQEICLRLFRCLVTWTQPLPRCYARQCKRAPQPNSQLNVGHCSANRRSPAPRLYWRCHSSSGCFS